MNDEARQDAAGLADELRVAFTRLRRRLREVEGPTELSAAQTSALRRIWKGEAAGSSALAALEGVRPQSMAAILTALERLGLIARRADPDDGRRQLVELTELGRRRVEARRAARDEWLAQALSTRLSDEELGQLSAAVALLERVTSE